MCGIVGYVGHDQAVPFILNGLSKLEYRGYDSAGIAFVDRDQKLVVTNKQGRLSALVNNVEDSILADIGIGHTRWATHGAPSDANAHPHIDCTEKIALVHNGIIENYAELREQLKAEGHHFHSETDTEAVVHLVEKFFTGDLEAALREAISYLHGSFSIAVVSQDDPERIVAAKKDSPLIVGLGDGENYIASDIPAILNKTRDIYLLEDGEFVTLTANQVIVTDFQGKVVDKQIFKVTWDMTAAEKGGYDHFMLKEIHEQPTALRDTMRGMIQEGLVNLSELGVHDILAGINKIYMVGCGTAYHAGQVGKMAIEKLAAISVECDIASEFRYRDVLWQPNSLMIAVSQSGETADTLAAVREAQKHGIKVLAITNVVGSAISRHADHVIYTHAGPEISVASTKAYSTQVLVLYMLALDLARTRGTLSREELETYSQDLVQLDRLVEQSLSEEGKIKAIAKSYSTVESTFFIGRNLDYAVALEGALKLKEISYLHAEAYAAGELKHGPLALIYEGVPVMALITQDSLVEKTVSNIREVKTRGAVVIGICKENLQKACAECDDLVIMPNVNPLLSPIVSVVPLQLFAYYMAIERETDVDNPRNLAKSVTVE